MGKKARRASVDGATAAASTASTASSSPVPAQDTAAPLSPSRDASSARSDFLKLFWTLAASDATTRTTAATQILTHLQELQAQQQDQNTDQEQAQGQDPSFESELQYTLRRLVRGLASSRDAARQGFSAALARLLAAFSTEIALDTTLVLLRDATDVHASSMKGMEQRERMFGRLFGLLAIQRSGRLATSDRSVTRTVILELVQLAQWKKWMREVCVDGVLTVLADVEPADFFANEIASELVRLLPTSAAKTKTNAKASETKEENATDDALSAEQIALCIGIQRYLDAHNISAKQLPAEFPATKIVRRKHLDALVPAILASSGCYPRVHSAWLGLFGHLLHTDSDASKVNIDVDLLQETWQTLVENALLAPATATHERKGLALKLFELLVPSLPGSVLRSILTPRFVQCIYRNSTSKKTYLHDAARHCLSVFASSAPNEYVLFFEREFVSPKQALTEDDEGDAEELAKTVKRGGFDAIVAIEEEQERVQAQQRRLAQVRIWALDNLLQIVNDVKSTSDELAAARSNVLMFVVFHAFFSAKSKETSSKTKTKRKKATSTDSASLDLALQVVDPALDATTRTACAKRVFTVITINLAAKDATESMLSAVFDTVQSVLATATPYEAMTKEITAQFATIQDRVASIRALDEQSSISTAFLWLFMSCAMQLLDPSQREDAAAAVEDLERCYDELQQQTSKGGKREKKKAGRRKSIEPKEEEEAHATVVLTDMLLSLLAQDSGALREIVAQVFRNIMSILDAESIAALVGVLQAADNTPPPGEEEEEDDDEHEEEEEEEEEIVLSSAAEIAKALRSDEGLAELHREDQTLSAIAGQVKGRAQQKKDAKKQRMQTLHFKLRVLDLLSTYATKCATNALVLRLVRPLFESLVAIPATDVEARVLKERLQSVLVNKLVRAKEVPVVKVGSEEYNQALDDFKEVVEKFRTTALDKEIAAKVATPVAVHLLRVLGAHADATALKKLRGIFEVAVRDVFTNKHAKFPRAVFDDVCTRFPRLGLHVVAPELVSIAVASSAQDVEKSTDGVATDDFTRAEVYRLLSLVLRVKHVTEADDQKLVKSWCTPLKNTVVSMLKKQAESTGSSKDTRAKRVKALLGFALQFVRVWQIVNPKSKSDALASIADAASAMETSSPVIKNMIAQLIEVTTGKKPVDTEVAKPKKRKRSIGSSREA